MRTFILTIVLLCLQVLTSSYLNAQNSAGQVILIERGDSIMRTKGDVVDARAFFLAATETGDAPDSLTAIAFARLAKTYPLDAGVESIDMARVYRTRSLRILEAMDPPPPVAMAAAYVDLSAALQSTQPDSSEMLIRAAIEIYRGMPKPPEREYLSTYNLLSRLGQVTGNNALALSAAEFAVDLLDRLTGLTDQDRYDTYVYAGLRQRAFKVGDSGEAYMKRGLAVAQRMSDPKMQARALLNLGAVYYTRGEIKKEEEQYLRALKTLSGRENTERYRASITNNLAFLYVRSGQLNEALETNAEALRLYKKYVPEKAFRAYAIRGTMYEAAGRFNEAVVTQDSAIRIYTEPHFKVVGGLAYPELDSLPDPSAVLDMYGYRMVALIGGGDVPRLIQNLNALLDAREFMTARSTSSVDESFWSSYEADNIEAALIFFARQDERADLGWTILNAIDRSRGSSLLTSLRVRRERENNRSKELANEVAELERKTQLENADAVRLREARMELDYLRTALRKVIPQGDVQTIENLKQFSREFSGDILNYYVSDNASYLVHVSPDGSITVDSLADKKTLERLVGSFRLALINSAYVRKNLNSEEKRQANIDQYTAVSDSLLTNLLPSARVEALSNRLLIIPSGPLSALPYGALVSKSTGTNFDGFNYLKDGRTISYGYALRHLRELEKLPEVDYDFTFLGVAPKFNGAANVFEVSKARGQVLEGEQEVKLRGAIPPLAPLLFNVEEVKRIAELIGDYELLVDNDATKNQFKASAGRAVITHLSTHGMVDGYDPNKSFIAFANNENLYFNDMDGAPLQAELVVLSACETSLGKNAEGENALSMSFAFAAAGARSTLTTLWQVDDKATQLFMVRFYEELVAGAPRSEALATAQRYLREETDFAHPYYWAGFVLHGADGSVELDPSGGNARLALGGAGLLLMLLGAGWWVLKKLK